MTHPTPGPGPAAGVDHTPTWVPTAAETTDRDTTVRVLLDTAYVNTGGASDPARRARLEQALHARDTAVRDGRPWWPITHHDVPPSPEVTERAEHAHTTRQAQARALTAARRAAGEPVYTPTNIHHLAADLAAEHTTHGAGQPDQPANDPVNDPVNVPAAELDDTDDDHDTPGY